MDKNRTKSDDKLNRKLLRWVLKLWMFDVILLSVMRRSFDIVLGSVDWTLHILVVHTIGMN